jgi:hypothetical protein
MINPNTKAKDSVCTDNDDNFIHPKNTEVNIQVEMAGN